MIKKIKTDNINIDILFNEIEHYKIALYNTAREYAELKLEHEVFRSVYVDATRRRIERLIEENKELKKEIENLKNNAWQSR